MVKDPAQRKRIPLATGCFDYFPDALAAVAEVSFVGNEKHNPGEPLHHSRGKSNDHPDAMQRHFTERGGFDFIELPNGQVFRLRHSAEMAWRALAILQEEIEAAGEAPLARGARKPEPAQPCAPAPDLSMCKSADCPVHRKYEVASFVGDTPAIRVVILNSRTACAGCGAWFKTEVRRMSEDSNEFRNQPQCPTCRGK